MAPLNQNDLRVAREHISRKGAGGCFLQQRGISLASGPTRLSAVKTQRSEPAAERPNATR